MNIIRLLYGTACVMRCCDTLQVYYKPEAHQHPFGNMLVSGTKTHTSNKQSITLIGLNVSRDRLTFVTVKRQII